MATPDCVNEVFEDTRAEVEVRGDYVHLTILSRFDEVILDVQLSVDEADDLAAKLLDAVATIDTRAAHLAAEDQARDGFDTSADDRRDVVDWAETPNPTFTQAVDELLGVAPR